MIDPSRITATGAIYLRDYLTSHIELGVDVGVMLQNQGEEESSVGSAVLAFAHACEALGSSKVEIFGDPRAHWLWRQGTLTAGKVMLDKQASIHLKGIGDVDAFLRRLHQEW